MYKIYIIFSALIFISCKQDENESINIDTYVDMYVVDKYGNDLLNPNEKHDKSINLNDLKIYYIIDEEEVFLFNNNYDVPRGFSLSPPEGKYKKYTLRCFFNSKYENSTSHIKWNQIDIDTITLEIRKEGSSSVCTKVELNGTEVWGVNYDNEDKERRLITIYK